MELLSTHHHGQLDQLTGRFEVPERILGQRNTFAYRYKARGTSLRRMGFGPDEVTSHGFRSTFTTFANESGLWNPDAIEAYCARQDSNAVRRAYNRSLYWDERVKMAVWWATLTENL